MLILWNVVSSCLHVCDKNLVILVPAAPSASSSQPRSWRPIDLNRPVSKFSLSTSVAMCKVSATLEILTMWHFVSAGLVDHGRVSVVTTVELTTASLENHMGDHFTVSVFQA